MIPSINKNKHFSKREIMKTFQLGMVSLTPYHSIIMEQLWFKCHELWLDIEKFRVYDDWKYLLQAIASDGHRFRQIHIFCNWDSLRNKKKYSLLGAGCVAKAPNSIPFWNHAELQKELVKVICSILCDKRSELLHFELSGVPLKAQLWDKLIPAIGSAAKLESLSLARSKLGDDNLRKLYSSLRALNKLAALNLADCSLSSASIQLLAELIQKQSLVHASSSWEKSLRHYKSLDEAKNTAEATQAIHSLRGTLAGTADLDWGIAIRRIVLNQNPKIKDAGAIALLNALSQEDIGVRALDMQCCGLSDESGKLMVDALSANQTLIVLDPRSNKQMHQELQRRVIEQAQRNGIQFPPSKSTKTYPWENNGSDPLETTYHYMYQLKKRFATTNATTTNHSPMHLLPQILLPAPQPPGINSGTQLKDRYNPKAATSPSRLVISTSKPTRTAAEPAKEKRLDLLELMETALNRLSKVVDQYEIKAFSSLIDTKASTSLSHAVKRPKQASAKKTTDHKKSSLARNKPKPVEDSRQANAPKRTSAKSQLKATKQIEVQDNISARSKALKSSAESSISRPPSTLKALHAEYPNIDGHIMFNYPESRLQDDELIDIALSAVRDSSRLTNYVEASPTPAYNSTLLYTNELLDSMERVTHEFETSLVAIADTTLD